MEKEHSATVDPAPRSRPGRGRGAWAGPEQSGRAGVREDHRSPETCFSVAGLVALRVRFVGSFLRWLLPVLLVLRPHPRCVERTSPSGGRRGAQRARGGGARRLDLSGVLGTGVQAKWVATRIQAHGDDFPGGWPKPCPSRGTRQPGVLERTEVSADVCGTRCPLPAPWPGLDAWGGAG